MKENVTRYGRLRVLGVLACILLAISGLAGAQQAPRVARNECAATYSHRLANIRRAIEASEDYASHDPQDTACADDDALHRRPLAGLSTGGRSVLVALDVLCYGDHSADCVQARASISAAEQRLDVR